MGFCESRSFDNRCYEKLEEIKDDLEVLRLKDIVNTYAFTTYPDNPKEKLFLIHNLACPLCHDELNKVQVEEINDILFNGKYRYLSLYTLKFKLETDFSKVDIFDTLELIHTEIEDIKNKYEERQYYKLFCEKKINMFILNYTTSIKINLMNFVMKNYL